MRVDCLCCPLPPLTLAGLPRTDEGNHMPLRSQISTRNSAVQGTRSCLRLQGHLLEVTGGQREMGQVVAAQAAA